MVTPHCELVRETAESLHMKISIDSGFRRGGSLLQWDGEKFMVVQRTEACTWHDDEDTSFSTEVADDFKGAVVRFWDQSNGAHLLGFTEEELNGPSPIKGWVTYSDYAKESIFLKTFGDWLTAIARNASIMTTESAVEKGKKHPSGNGQVLVELPYSWGDQAAEHYVVLDRDGNILAERADCGENAPWPIITDTGWEFTSLNEENNYWRVARNRAESSRWADVADYICSAYKQEINPLLGLRKQYRGKWEYHKNGVPAYSRATVIFSEAEFPWEKSWAVTYTAVDHRYELPVVSTPPINPVAKVLEAVLV